MEARLPAVHRLLAHPRLQTAREKLGPESLRQLVREVLQDLRRQGRRHASLEDVLYSVEARVAELARPSYPAVINATGVLIHTNLGRAPLLPQQVSGYVALEFSLAEGCRGERLAPVREKLCRYFGCEDALVVTNNAAALLLLLAARARGRQVLVSRGELIEIGGSFRLPEIMAEAGVELVEVGCTNRTHLADYRRALSPQTAAILQVHRSNFALTGFVATPTPQELASLARETGVSFWVDQGSGCHLDLTRFGLAKEATVQELLTAGAEVVLFSGDKLLAGPQAGILVGKRQTLEPLRQHPLRRAVRPDKGVLVGLAATLDAYLAGQPERVPLYQLLAEPLVRLRQRALRLRRTLQAAGIPAQVVPCHAVLGGGTTPGEVLPSYALALPDDPARSRALRQGEPPVIGRQERGQLLLDLRAVFPEQDKLLAAAVVRAFR